MTPEEELSALDDDDLDPIIIEGMSSASFAAVLSVPGDVTAAGHWDGDDRTMPPTAPAAVWDGDDRTMPPTAPAAVRAPAAVWDGDDRTMPPSTPAAVWDGDDRTQSPAVAAHTWDGDDRTAPPSVPGPLVGGPVGTRFRPAAGRSDGSSSRFAPAGAAPATSPLMGRTDQAPHAESLTPAAEAWLKAGRSGPLSGSLLGDFLLGGILGEGGMGIVYRAWQVSLRREAAIKVLASNLANDDTLVRRFYAEAHTASRIASQHVVQVYFAGEVADTVFFAMEFVAGSDLHQIAHEALAAGRKLSPTQVLDYVVQAAEGLAAAAKCQVVHRDIKPQNLLVTATGVVKIADFGIAKALDEQSLTLAGQTVGTPAYASPEQGRGLPVDHRGDLYSLGVVLYELLAGKKPFAANSPNALIYQHNYAEPPPLRSQDEAIPEAYESVVMRLLMKDPAQRYQSAEDLVADIQRLRAGHAPAVPEWTWAQGTGAKEALARDQGWRSRLLIPAIVAMLVIGSATVWGVAHYSTVRAEQTDIQRRKQNLAVLDQALLPPASAGEDLEWLRGRLGSTEADVVRWSEKLARIQVRERHLAALDGGGTPAPAERLAAEAELGAYITDVGAAGVLAKRWSAVLQGLQAEAMRLRGALAVLDQPAPFDRATAQRLHAALLRLIALVGPEDAQVRGWQTRFTNRTQRLAALQQQLAGLDDSTIRVTEPLIESWIPALQEWRASTASDDADARRWDGVIADFRERLAGVRVRLQRLERVDQPSLPLVEELASDLAECRLMTAPDDPQRRAWEAKVAATATRVATLRGELAALLDPNAPLALGPLISAERLLGSYRADVSPDDGRLVAWERRCASERRDIAALLASAARLDQPPALSAGERASLRRTVDELAQRQAASTAQLSAWRQRLADEVRTVDDLRLRLAAHATAGTLRSEPAAALAGSLAPMVSIDDRAAVALLDQRTEIIRLASELGDLDRLATEPAQANLKLARWRQLNPVDELDGQRWAAKLERIEGDRRTCARLDGVGEPDAATRLCLERLSGELVGPADSDVRRWRARVDQLAALRHEVEAALPLPVLAPGLADAVTTLAALIGETPEVRLWRTRLQVLTGPPRPVWAADSGRDQAGPWVVVVDQGQRVRLRYVPAGVTRVGSPAEEPGRDDDEGQATMTLSHSFWLAETEVTQRWWKASMGANPSAFVGDERPVDSVSWNEAQAFCAALAARIPGLQARLPSEVEFETACRAGGEGPYHGAGDALSAEQLATSAWFSLESGSREVGTLAPNRLGLFDLHGNVWEWCVDRYDRYPALPAIDWVGVRGDQRVVRGGSWSDPAVALRAANRVALAPGSHSRVVGFRIAVTVPEMP